jgi:hypothetical protein
MAAQRPPAIEAVPIYLVDYGTYPLAQNDTSDDDAALFEVVERYQIAYGDYVRLGEIAAAKLLTAIGEKHPKPEVLRVRAADRGLGLPQPASPKATSYDLPYDVDALRKPNRQSSTGFVAQTPEARARADEIVQAYEKWWSTVIVGRNYRAIRSLHAAERQMYAAGRLARKLQDRVIKTPARTADGRIAKARCLAVAMSAETDSV